MSAAEKLRNFHDSKNLQSSPILMTRVITPYRCNELFKKWPNYCHYYLKIPNLFIFTTQSLHFAAQLSEQPSTKMVIGGPGAIDLRRRAAWRGDCRLR